MPIDSAVSHTIACDNPACPGNDLDPNDRTGWLFVQTELHGLGPMVAHVYCSATCASADAPASFGQAYPPPEESLAEMPHVPPLEGDARAPDPLAASS